jgi:uncharacterized membrane protein HdeD (DUF308 family)
MPTTFARRGRGLFWLYLCVALAGLGGILFPPTTHNLGFSARIYGCTMLFGGICGVIARARRRSQWELVALPFVLTSYMAYVANIGDLLFFDDVLGRSLQFFSLCALMVPFHYRFWYLVRVHRKLEEMGDDDE